MTDKQDLVISRMQKDIDELRADFATFTQAYMKMQVQQDLLHERNMEAIKRTNNNVTELAASVKGLVEAWTVANGIRKLVIWLSSFAALGGAAVWIARTFFNIKL